MNPDDARPGGLMADADTHAGVPEQGGPAGVAGQGGPAGVAGQGEPTGVPGRAESSGACGQGGPTGVPGQGGAAERREVSFRTSGLRIELEMAGGDGSRRLAGRLIPAQSAVVEIRGIITVQADAAGRFIIEDVPAGLLSLRCRLGAESDRARVATGWVTL